MFGRKMRGLEDAVPVDPNEPLVRHIFASYPFGNEAFGLESMIRLMVFTIQEMKERGLLK